MSNMLGNTCTACGVDRRKRQHIRYHPETFMPYCDNPYVCNKDHPNSIPNILKNMKETKLVTFEEAKDLFQTYLETTQESPEYAEKMRRIVSSPMTIRVSSVEMAKFLIGLETDLQLPSMSDTVRYCIQQMMDAKGHYVHKHAEVEQEQQEEQELEQTISSFVSDTVAPPADPFAEPTSDDTDDEKEDSPEDALAGFKL